MNVAQRIDNYLRRKGSPLAGKGRAFVKSGKKYGIDPLLLVAISGAESSFGKQNSGSYNPFGWGPGIGFASYEQAIDRVAKGLRTGYLDKGLKTINAIGGKWAPPGAGNDPTGPNNNWTRNVTSLYDELGGRGIGRSGLGTSPSSGAGAGGQNPGLTAAPELAPDFSGMALENLGEIVSGRKVDPVQTLSSLAFTVASAPKLPAVTQQAPKPSSPSQQAANPRAWVRVPPPGGHSSPSPGKEILGAVAGIAKMYGKPLSVFDNTLHSKYTVNGRVSAHSAGRALDIAATGARLRRIGYLALRYAGMGEKEARAAMKKGGLYNVGHYQIIFATKIGGNHYNHVHVGLRG